MNIFRIENPDTNNGMWYDGEGNYSPFIETLSDGKSASLPMGWEARYGQGGRRWFSGCHSVELMRHWFSDQDARELLEAGYGLYKFESDEFIVEEFQVIFTREGIVSTEEISLADIWSVRV